jgi:hypothetical protein
MKTREETIKALSEALATIAQVEKQILDLLKDVVANEPSQEPVVSKPMGKRGPLPQAPHTGRIARRLEFYEDDIQRLHAEGLHISGIAKAIGVHRDTAALYLRELGITPNKAKGKNFLGGRIGARAPSEREQNENLKQNPWETSNDA